MAFKIKSAKIFLSFFFLFVFSFFGIKEHTVMLLSVVLSYLRRLGRYRALKQEEDMRRFQSCILRVETDS